MQTPLSLYVCNHTCSQMCTHSDAVCLRILQQKHELLNTFTIAYHYRKLQTTEIGSCVCVYRSLFNSCGMNIMKQMRTCLIFAPIERQVRNNVEKVFNFYLFRSHENQTKKLNKKTHNKIPDGLDFFSLYILL